MLSAFVERAVGLDVHKKTIVACALLGPGDTPRVVKQRFGTFAADLRKLREWIVSVGCTHVLMESTGVYWWPVYQMLEEVVTVIVGNAWHLRRVPGRKTDMSDAHWLAVLLRMGLVEPSFIPPRPIRALRELTRYRRKLVQDRTAAQARVDKLLEIAGIKLSSVASELFGVSGRHMLAAMAEGTEDPTALAELARGRLRVKKAELKLAFEPSLPAETRQLLDTELKHVDRLDATLAELELHLDQQLNPTPQRWPCSTPAVASTPPLPPMCSPSSVLI